MQNTSLQTLIEASAAGDSDAFKTLYQLTSNRVFRFVRSRSASRSDALDLVQDIYVDFWKALRSFRYEDDARVEAFLYTIASRKLARYYRFRSRHISLEAISDLVDEAASSEMSTDIHDVLASVQTLSARDRELIQLRYLAGMSFSEIAQLLGERESTLKVRHHRAITRLKKRLGYEAE